MAALTDAELRAKTDVFRQRLAEGETLDDILFEAFAVVREAATRVLGQRHYDVQLMGGMALHFGWIAEMKTGEGKTLVSTLPVYLNALAGEGVHVVTVNDYLATRDANWMGAVHRFLGISVGRVGPDLPDFDDKRAAYACDVTYGTNTEFGFDYLRDNMARRARAHGPARPPLRHRRRGRLDPDRRGAHAAHHLGPGVGRDQALLPVRLHRAHADARRRLRGRRGEEDGRARPRRASRRSSASSAWPTSTTRSRPTTSTSWARRCAPRSSTTATRTTWSTPARSRSSTSSPAARSRGGAGPTGCTRPSRPRSACASRRRTTPGRP